jgi:hypothetical protein
MPAVCEECRRLWRQYEIATTIHFQADSKLRLAVGLNDLDMIDALTREMEAAEGVRREMREAIRQHGEHGPGIARAATGEKTE